MAGRQAAVGEMRKSELVVGCAVKATGRAIGEGDEQYARWLQSSGEGGSGSAAARRRGKERRIGLV